MKATRTHVSRPSRQLALRVVAAIVASLVVLGGLGPTSSAAAIPEGGAAPALTPPLPLQRFADVSPYHSFAYEIQWMFDFGISTGTSQPPGLPLFKPAESLSRAAFAAFLYRYSDSPAVAGGEPVFADVGQSHPFYSAIQWMGTTGLSTGTPQLSGKPLFKPADLVSRAATAAFLWRLAGEPESELPAKVTDVSPSDPFADAISWMFTAGISYGYVIQHHAEGNHTYTLEFRGGQTTQRQAVAAMLKRYAWVTKYTFCGRATGMTPAECEALVAIWVANDGQIGPRIWKPVPSIPLGRPWNDGPDPCDWDGVYCSGGHVTRLYLWAPVIPAELGELTHLDWLHIHGVGDAMTTTLPAELGDLAELRFLGISGQQISGTLPDVITGLAELDTVEIVETSLSGSIPDAFASIPLLEHVTLTNNEFTGPVPASLATLTYLSSLRLTGNGLTGAIPSALGDLHMLNVLNLEYNQLTGAIPPSFGGLWNLQYLGLSHNEISGPVPEGLMQLDLDATLGLTLSGNGCFTAANGELTAWLDTKDPNWDDGCAAP